MKEETIKNVNEEELRKMFREGIPFKVKVTPEVSEKIQKIGFEEGVKWAGGRKEVGHTEEPGLFFNIDHNFAFAYTYEIGSYFSSQKEQEICFIETKEEKSFFSSQQEIWKYLVEEEGRKVVMIGDETRVLGFKDGVMHNFYVNGFEGVHDATLAIPSNWKPYVEKLWYENIPEQGVLCWIGDEESCVLNKKSADIVTRYLGDSYPYPFLTRQGSGYRYATPLTKEEVENLIWKEKE